MLHWIIKCCLSRLIVSGVLRITTNFILFIIYFNPPLSITFDDIVENINNIFKE